MKIFRHSSLSIVFITCLLFSVAVDLCFQSCVIDDFVNQSEEVTSEATYQLIKPIDFPSQLQRLVINAMPCFVAFSLKPEPIILTEVTLMVKVFLPKHSKLIHLQILRI